MISILITVHRCSLVKDADDTEPSAKSFESNGNRSSGRCTEDEPSETSCLSCLCISHGFRLSNQVLKTLNLSDNACSLEGMIRLADAVRVNQVWIHPGDFLFEPSSFAALDASRSHIAIDLCWNKSHRISG